MLPTIVFPDAELWACFFLRDELPTAGYPNVHVSNRKGTEPVAIWVRRDGGGALDVIREAPRLGINVFHRTEQEVTDLARVVSSLLVASPDGEPVVKATEVTGPTPVADNQPRRFLSIELVVRGTPSSG
jgi:hypothetical protein